LWLTSGEFFDHFSGIPEELAFLGGEFGTDRDPSTADLLRVREANPAFRMTNAGELFRFQQLFAPSCPAADAAIPA
jgi:hypothetical protein